MNVQSSDGPSNDRRAAPGRVSPMVFAAVYSLVMPLLVGLFAVWLSQKSAMVETLRAWQTLLAGGMAVIAAALGGLFVLNQTSAGRRQEAHRTERRHAAARAVMPLALSALVEYAEEVAEMLESVRAGAVGRRVTTLSGVSTPKIDPQIIPPLRDVIETGVELIGECVAQCIADVQVLDARLRSLAKNLRAGSHHVVSTFNLDTYIVDAAVIHARGSALFDYGRRKTDASPTLHPTEEQLITALNLMGFDESTHPQLYAGAKSRARTLSGGT